MKRGVLYYFDNEYLIYVGKYNGKHVFLKTTFTKPENLIHTIIRLKNGNKLYIIPVVNTYYNSELEYKKIIKTRYKISDWEIECLIPGLTDYVSI